MQVAVPAGVGAMAALLKMPDEKLDGVLAEAAQGEVVTAANLNSPDQIVIAGHAGRGESGDGTGQSRGREAGDPFAGQCPFHCP